MIGGGVGDGNLEFNVFYVSIIRNVEEQVHDGVGYVKHHYVQFEYINTGALPGEDYAIHWGCFAIMILVIC